MSWNWNEREDKDQKREYDVKGTVTISTEEYRDLIEEKEQLWQAGQKEHDSWWEEYKAKNELEKKVSKLQAKIDVFEEFLADHKTVKEDYDNFCLRKLKEKDDE